MPKHNEHPTVDGLSDRARQCQDILTRASSYELNVDIEDLYSTLEQTMVRISRSRAAAAAAAAVAMPASRTRDPSITSTPSAEIDDGHGRSASEREETPPADDIEDQGKHDEGRLGTPDAQSDTDSPRESEAPRRGVTSRRRGRRPGARGGTRRRESNSDGGLEDSPDALTPRKRGGWRGRGFGGGRWGRARAGHTNVTQVPVDKEGNLANVVDDEIELPRDPEGETKVTMEGELLGGREYRVRTFTIDGRGDRLYMLSTEPARCMGFRDSYLFFQKHKQLYKIIIDEDAKKDLIDRGLIPHSYKGRAIGVVTARSVFREFGAQIIVGGKKIVDDYRAGESRARGDIEGEYAVPEDELPEGSDAYDRNRYVAWHGASAVYHTATPNLPMNNGKFVEIKKRKIPITGSNWMFEHAHAASLFNSSSASQRRNNRGGIYDVHTNFMHYPIAMQPTHARWERVDSDSISTRSRHSKDLQRRDDVEGGDSVVNENEHFPDLPPFYARRSMISDIVYESPSRTISGYPGPEEALMDVNVAGLSHIPKQITQEIPEDCHTAFVSAKREERLWKNRWAGEKEDHCRDDLLITYSS